MEISQVSTDTFFKKSHELVFSQLSLTPVEHDILALMLSSIHQSHWQEYEECATPLALPVYKYTSKELSDWFRVEPGNLHKVLKEPAARLTARSIGIQDDNKKSFRFTALFSHIEYKDGCLYIAPNHALMNEYLGISKGHSQIPKLEFRLLKRDSSKRLYSMLCRFKNGSGSLNFMSIDQLHGIFGLKNQKGELAKKTYATVGNFVSRIIKPAIEEIENVEPRIKFLEDEHSGNRGFEYKKEGRKVVAIRFIYAWDTPCNEAPVQEGSIEMAKVAYSKICNKEPVSRPEIDALKVHAGSLMLQGGYRFDGEFSDLLRALDETTD